ncbi:NAD(P)-binding protein [Aureobasidium pullulans]|uniref:NAD(P)-binding protein n=1 Tax=Aureobasidium pullulans TaxID=5580 RepID=A0A4T0DGP8_AURPU|nr:NAD(P)-binding protein [Aureobasidium pullulans]
MVTKIAIESDTIYKDTDPAALDARPDTSSHREIDLAILDARNRLGLKAKLFIMLPPLIYGASTHGKLSIQVMTMARFALKHKYAGYVGGGKGIWGLVHVKDLSYGYATILQWLEASPDEVSLENPYFFCENGEEATWAECAAFIGKELKAAGKIEDEAPRQIPEEQYGDLFGKYSDVVIASNARNRAERLRQLGWRPKYTDIHQAFRDEELPVLLNETGEFNGYGKAAASGSVQKDEATARAWAFLIERLPASLNIESQRGKGGRKEEEEEKVEAWAMTDLSSETGCGAGLEHEAAAGKEQAWPCTRVVKTNLDFDINWLTMSAEDFAGQWDAGEHCLANNPVLVALAQNGALRLRCDRATISLLDDLRLSVIAEATPSTSPFGLQEHALYREHDPTSRSIAVFSHPTGHESIASHDFVADTTRLVVRDIRTLDQPEDCSHQVAPPHLVSFAEVPIRNPSGHLLGTYCIIDDKVRHDFFHDETTLVLTDIANAISTFLELHTSTTIPNSCLAHCLDDQPIQLLRQHMTPSSDSSQTDQPRSETTFSFHHSLDTPRSEASDFAFALPTPDRCSSASNSHTASPDFDAHESKH